MNDHSPAVRTVALHGGTTSRAIPAEHVYFAFGDGRLTYDCVSCNAKCCRGHGYELLPGVELQKHVATASAVRFFMEPCGEVSGKPRHFHVRNAAPGCFFLGADGRCGVQQQHGYAAKPETCRVFPFNTVRRLGDYLIVAPHPTLCPLAIVESGPPSPLSRHAELLDELVERGLGLHIEDITVGVPDPARTIALERRIVELSDAQTADGNWPEFVSQQAAAHASVFGGAIDASLADAGGIAAYEGRIREALGAGGASPMEPGLGRLLIAITPALRVQLALSPAAQSHDLPMDRLPRALMAVAALADLARDAGMAAVTYQTVMTLMGAYRPLITMLAHLDDVVAWRGDAAIDMAFPGDAAARTAYVNVVRQLLPRSQQQHPRALGEVIAEHAPFEGLDRVTFLKKLAQRLSGRITRLDGRPGHHRASTRRAMIKGAIQRWAIQQMPARVLIPLTERAPRPAR